MHITHYFTRFTEFHLEQTGCSTDSLRAIDNATKTAKFQRTIGGKKFCGSLPEFELRSQTNNVDIVVVKNPYDSRTLTGVTLQYSMIKGNFFYFFFILFGGVLSSHPGTYMKFSLITIIWYIYMALMSLRSRSHVKASMVLTRTDHLFIHNYIRSLLNNILRPILLN